VALKNQAWVVMFAQNRDVFLAPLVAQTRASILLAIVTATLVAAAGFFVAQTLSAPIVRLTAFAEQVSAGDLSAQAKVESSDEIGVLGTAFNSMTLRLRETLEGLEHRVAERTRDLEIVAEVSTATATILESKRLLQEVVDLTKERFSLYHSHIYLLDEEGKNLVLAAGAGEPGRQMLARGLSIPLDREQSLVARAARERKGVTVNDVTQAPDFLPNPLLPNTRSELAVPMLVGGNLIGVFDIQSDQVRRFTAADVNIQTTMAAQLATSIQNVRSFERAKKQAEFEAQVSSIGQKIQQATSMEDTLQTAIREIGLVLGATRVSANIASRRASDNNGSQN
jgi:nitrate/nitrite-specific signal transduction histidine kinase